MTAKVTYICLFACLLLGMSSCKKYVCPTYSGAFLLGVGHTDAFFSYFTEDSLPREDGLMASRGKTWYGLAKPRRQFQLTGIVTGDKVGIGANYPRVILMDPRYPEDSTMVTPDSVILKETDLEDLFDDAVVVEGGDGEAAPAPSADTQADSAALAKGDFQIDDPDLPPRNFEQFYYELMFRDQLIEWLQSGPENEEADSLGLDSLQANQKKWWQFWKKKDTGSLAEGEEDGGPAQEKGFVAFLKRLFGGGDKKEKPKTEEEQKIEKIKEQQKKEAEESTDFDDW